MMRSLNVAAKNLPFDGILDDEGHRAPGLVFPVYDILVKGVDVADQVALEAHLVVGVALVPAGCEIGPEKLRQEPFSDRSMLGPDDRRSSCRTYCCC